MTWLNWHNHFWLMQFQVIPGLIPRPSEGCPEKTVGCYAPGCPNTCYCEDHCSWQRCSLFNPPVECFDDINGTWFRKYKGDHWVANFRGNYLYAYTISQTCMYWTFFNFGADFVYFSFWVQFITEWELKYYYNYYFGLSSLKWLCCHLV